MHKGGRSVRLNIRCKPEIKTMLTKMAQHTDVTAADVINDLIIIGYRELFGQEALHQIIEEFSNDKS